LANKRIDRNKINKESKNNRIANDRGVGSTDLLGIKSFLLALSIFVNNE